MPTIGRRPTSLPFPSTTGLGVTAAEIKARQPQAPTDPAIAPMPQTGPTEFLTPSGSSEHLRLRTPVAANPLATPTGPLHDHINIRQAMSKAESDLSKQLFDVVARDKVEIPANRQGQIRASLAREKAMVGLLRQIQDMQQQIYGHIIGGAEA